MTASDDPAPPSREASLEHAVALLQKQNDIIAHWITLFFQVQSALGAAAALVYYWAADSAKAFIALVAILLLAGIGIGIALMIGRLCLRHHEWQRYYVGRVRGLQDPRFPLYDDTGPKEEGSTKYSFESLRTGAVLLWTVFALFAIAALP